MLLAANANVTNEAIARITERKQMQTMYGAFALVMSFVGP